MKKNEGITLISLIITIIVILILAGISVGLIIENGIFNQVSEVEKLNENAIKRADDTTDELLNENIRTFTVDNSTE